MHITDINHWSLKDLTPINLYVLKSKYEEIIKAGTAPAPYRELMDEDKDGEVSFYEYAKYIENGPKT